MESVEQLEITGHTVISGDHVVVQVGSMRVPGRSVRDEGGRWWVEDYSGRRVRLFEGRPAAWWPGGAQPLRELSMVGGRRSLRPSSR